MYNLTTFLTTVMGYEDSEVTHLGIYCIETDCKNVYEGNKIMGRVACNTIVVVERGWLVIVYDGHELTLRENDMFVYTPGFTSEVISSSEDYHATVLLTDEGYTLDLPTSRNFIRSLNLPFTQQYEPMCTLKESHARHLIQLMRRIKCYIASGHLYKSDALKMLYSLFLLDLMSARNQVQVFTKVPAYKEEIFLQFMRMLPGAFVDHHDIGYYASELHITTTYLSRIVKALSGRTVVDHINQMLTMEAVWLLQQPELSIEQIAGMLNFSSLSSFSKFFTRLKGVSPKSYRMQRKRELTRSLQPEPIMPPGGGRLRPTLPPEP